MQLPIPTPDELAEFQHLYQQYFGVHLSSDEALETSMRLLALVHFTKNYALLPVRPAEQRRELGQADAKP